MCKMFVASGAFVIISALLLFNAHVSLARERVLLYEKVQYALGKFAWPLTVVDVITVEGSNGTCHARVRQLLKDIQFGYTNAVKGNAFGDDCESHFLITHSIGRE